MSNRVHARRTARARGLALAAAALLTVEVNYIAARHAARWDWTASGLYTLSRPSRDALAALDRDVTITSFLDPVLPAYETVRDVLERYRSASERIDVRHVDRAADPAGVRSLLARYDLSPYDAPYHVVVSSAGRNRIVALDDLVDTGARNEVVLFRGEAVLTGAILALQREGGSTVYLLAGHGEMIRDEAGFRGLGTLARTLERSGLEVRTLDMGLAGGIPADARTVVVADPGRAWPTEHLTALDRYLERGGRALVLLSPLASTEPPWLRRTGLEALLARWGVRVENAVLVDPRARTVVVPEGASGRIVPLAASTGIPVPGHPVVRNLASLATLLSERTRPVGTASPPPEGLTTARLLESVPDAYGETDLGALIRLGQTTLDATDLPGPVGLAVAVEAAPREAGPEVESVVERPGGARLVVFGSAELASDAVLQVAANDRLLLNAVSWLVGEERALGIEPRDVGQIPLYLGGQQLWVTFLVLVVIIPGLALTGGVAVWLSRRRDARP